MKKVFIKDLVINKTESLLCFIANIRDLKNIIFIDIYDSTGEIQAIASKESCSNFNDLLKLTPDSSIELLGYLNDEKDFIIKNIKIIALATYKLPISPNSKLFDPFDNKNSKYVIDRATLYMRNIKLSKAYYLKSCFKREIQNYLWNNGFIEFEAPTLTKQTLYENEKAIWLEVDKQPVSLSRCATFHLEPALIPYEKVFTITNSHSKEKIRTNRHLAEYGHLKIEICWANLEELIDYAKNLYYNISKSFFEKYNSTILSIVEEKVIIEKLEKLNPKNHIQITYDDAVKLLKTYNVEIEYGKSLRTKDEKIITKHFGESFVWIKYIPYTVEGFMFKRNEKNHFLTQTCDLIAPNGFGEILGCAEKMTDYDDLINSMKEKNKYCDYKNYEDYCLLHKFGLPYHGGIGMGIERALRYLLDLDHVKYVKPFAVVKSSKINH